MRVACCVWVLVACGRAEAPVIPQDPRSGQVVARVDGETVTAGDVEALARAEGLGPREALDRLEGEALLVAEARRRGIAPDRDEETRLAVRALLDHMEEETRPRDIPVEEVQASFEAGRAQGERPERRQATLVAVTGDAARRVARTLQAAMREDAAAALASARSGHDGDLAVEDVELEASDSPIATALFAASCDPPCVLPELVDHEGRLHVVLFQGVTEAVRLRLEDVEEEIRRQLAVAARAARLEEFLGSRRSVVTLHEANIARAVEDGALEDLGR